MLARSAEDLYWVGRYLERAEQTARLVDVTYHRLLESPPRERVDAWRDVLDTLGMGGAFSGGGALTDSVEVAGYLVSSVEHNGTVAAAIDRARENSRGVREHLPVELWEAINTFWHEIRGLDLDREMVEQPHHLYSLIRRRCQGVVGIADATWLRADPWRYFTLGRYLERAQLTAQLVRVRHPRHRPDATHEWTATLRSASALQAYRRNYQHFRDPLALVELLLGSDEMPRSVLFCVRRVELGLESLGRGQPTMARKQVGRLRADLEFGDVSELVERGIEESVADIERRIRRINASLAAEYFLVPLQHGLHTLRLGAVDSVGERT